MRTRKNPIPPEYQRPRPLMVGGFAEDEGESEYLERLPITVSYWDNNCDGETYENLDLRHMDFKAASLVGTKFVNCDLRLCTFAYANLTDAEFIDCDLRSALLLAVRSTYINFENSDLRSCEFSVYTYSAAPQQDLTSFNWNNVRIEGAFFSNLDFVKYVYDLYDNKVNASNLFIQGFPRFSISNSLKGFDLSNSRFLNSSRLRYANLQDTNLQNADLRFADMRGADLRGANLKGSNLQGALYDDGTKGLTTTQTRVMVYKP